MRGVNSNPVSASSTPSTPSRPQAGSSRPGLSRRLEPSTARLAGLPANAGTPIAEQVIYEVRSPAALADRILARPDDSFWLLGYQSDRPRPLEQAPQRFFNVAKRGSALVVREENGNERECVLGADRSALIGFLADTISGPRRLYLSVLQPPARQPLGLERSAEQPSARQVRPGLDVSSTLTRPALNEPVEQADPAYHPGPALTSTQRQAARSVPRFTGRRQGNAPALPPAQVQALLGVAPEAFCHNVEDFQLGFRVLMTISQGRLPQDQRDRCERQAAAMIEQAQVAARHWPDADFRVMTFLCNDCKSNTRHHPALLGVLASMLLHHSAALKTETLGFVANCLSHYRGGDGTDRGRVVKSAAMKLAERFSATGQRVVDPKDLSLLANCFSKWPSTNACTTALSNMARSVCRGRLSLASASAQSLGILANAWSKNADDPDCAGALAKLANELVQGRLRIDDARPQHTANLANAWAKCAENPDCARVLAKLARDLLEGRLKIDDANSQDLANLANAWSKNADDPDCASALARLARGVLQGRLRIDDAAPLEISSLANAWSKNADDPDCASVLAKFAGDLLQGRLRIDAAQPQDLSNLANAWAKHAEQPDCAGALAKLARDLLQNRLRLNDAQPQHIANLANAWSKPVNDSDCARALARLAGDVLHRRLRLDDAQPQHVANLANAWAKHVDNPDCAAALAKLARDVLQGRLRIDAAQPQDLSSLANAWAKHDSDPDCAAALAKLAQNLIQGSLQINDANSQVMANLANAWSKLPDDPDCARALTKLARDMHQGRLQLDDANSLAIANLANAWAKLPDNSDCAKALARLGRDVNQGRLNVDDAKSQHAANLANAWSKHVDNPDCAGALAKLAQNLLQGRLQIDATQPQHAATLANAWSKQAAQPDCAGALAELARDRLEGRLRIDAATPQDLANLANAWSKQTEHPDCASALSRLAQDLLQGRLRIDAATPQDLASLANAWSKQAEHPDCASALAKLARDVLQGHLRIDKAGSQAIANLANAWSKQAEHPDCARALARLASDVLHNRLQIDYTQPQHAANLANAWSKHPEDPNCAAALARLARDLLQGRLRIDNPQLQHVANLANAWSKCAEAPDCANALAKLARDLLQGHLRVDDAPPLHAANLANAWAKLAADPDCARALVKLARNLLQNRLHINDATPRDLANLANAWSKHADNPDCANALAKLAREVLQGRLRIDDAQPRHVANLANLANAWAKRPEDPDCARVLAKLARDLLQGRLRIDDAKSQELANLANAWSKHAEQPDCASALAKFAHDFLQGRLRVDDTQLQHITNLANAWSKCAENPDCAGALAKLARDVFEDRLRIDDTQPQHVANLVNAWTHCDDQPDCRAAINRLAAHALSGNGPATDDFTIQGLALLAHALARNSRAASAAEESDVAGQSIVHLTDLALRLEETPAKFEEATTRNLAMFLRALGRAGLRDERRRLAPVMLQRLEQLHKQTPPFQDANLETFGHLAIGLRPLALQSQRKQCTLRGQTLQALDHLQPVIARALAQQTASADDTHQSRLPAVSVRYLFETYTVVANTLKPRHLPRVDDGSYTSKALHERRQALKQWLTAEEARLRPLFEGSNDVSLWDLQTRLRAPGTGLGGGLDRLLAERANDWRVQQPPSVFDVRQALANMDHPPRTPKGDVGIFQPPRIDVRGRPLEQTGAARYHVLTHLTGGKLPYAVVELANKPTLSTLEHPITYQDQSWRIDLTGGSRMKKGQVRASNVMKAEGERPGGPQLMALRLSDTLPGSAYDDLARALMPAREDFFRFQRMFLSSPPEGIPGLKPQDHVLQGNFRIGILPDRVGAHGFRFNDAKGRPIALQPHDGCGFIRQSLLEKLPACQRAWGKGADGKAVRPLPPFATRDPGNLPGQALQHYPRSTAVAKEVQTQLVSMTAERPPENERLFRAVATGLIQGHMAVVVPSADNRVHLSTAKATDFQKHGGGVLIGRSPYDKPNLRPLTEDRVATAEQGDPTAEFLDRCTTLQYSYVGDQAKADGGKSALFASKGLMVGIPDELWPDPDTDIVMSAQDVKTHSDWKAGKQRVTEDTLAHSKGLLVANEVFTAGSVIAMPRAEQQRLDGDFDGDTVVVVAGRPQLFEHVRQFDQSTPLPPTLKPPKTHSTPFDAEDDHYQHGRSKEIMPVYAGVMEQFSGLQTRSLAQPVAVRDSIATRMLYGSFEGLPKGWKRQARAVLGGETVDAKQLGELRQGLLDQQRNSPARRAPARALEAELLNQLEALQHGANAASGALPNTDEIPGMAALREDYKEARTGAERIEALLNCYPERQLSSQVGYEKPDNPQLCLQNLLSLGIKAGTDAYKSQTGVYEFRALGRRLDRLLRSHGTVMEAPYTKGTASRLTARRFDVANTQRELKDNPTLAASVMSAALAVPAVQKALQDQQPDTAPSASDRQRARQLATELQARAQASHGAVASTLEAVLGQTAAGTLFERGQECKGRDSMLDKILRNQQVWGGDDLLSQAKNVNDALRFHVELDDQHFTRQYRAIMDALDGQGARRVRTVNCFNLGDKARYKGINVTRAVTVNGENVPFEIQFHSPQSRAMKKQCHGLYKDAQKRQVRDDQQQRIETLEETMRQRWSEVPSPPGVERIGNSGGDWPARGLWATLTAKGLPDEPMDEEDESDTDEDDS